MIEISGPGGLSIPVFSVLIGVSAALGLAWAAWQAPHGQALEVVNAGIWAGVGAMIGARGFYVMSNWGYFQANRLEAIQIFQGGLSWPGALLGGILALAIYAGFSHQPLGFLADSLLPFTALLTISAWLGCWLDGCAYGPASNAWWTVPARDETGNLAQRAPVQLLGALLVLGLFWFLQVGIRSTPLRDFASSPGRTSSLGLLGLAVILLGLSFWRADPAPYEWGLRLESWAALAFAAFGAASLYLCSILDRR